MHAHNLKKWLAGSIMGHYGTKIEQQNLSLVGRCRFARWPLANVHGFLATGTGVQFRFGSFWKKCVKKNNNGTFLKSWEFKDVKGGENFGSSGGFGTSV